MSGLFHGEQTDRALENFGSGQTPRDLIRSYALVKEACLLAQQESLATYNPVEMEALLDTLHEIQSGTHDILFQLPLEQGGAGTSLNMNLNEVIAFLAQSKLHDQGVLRRFHTLEEINRFQSTNDTFPTAVTIIAYEGLARCEKLVVRLQETLVKLERDWTTTLITGRTEYQDALPITLGQLFGSWAGPVERDRWRLSKLKERVRTISLGGTAVGTCFSAPRDYIFAVEKHLRRLTGLPLSRSQNLTDEIAHLDKFSELASGLRLVAENLFRLTGDLLFYTSSPVAEMTHPNLQSGSTIMAAKTNPVILEFVQGLAIEIQGETYKISLHSQNGRLQLNAYLPFLTASLLRIFSAVERALHALVEKFFPHFSINVERIEENLSRSNALLNALLPELGYDRIRGLLPVLEQSKPKTLHDLKKLLREHLGLTEQEVARLIDPQRLTSSTKESNNGRR